MLYALLLDTWHPAANVVAKHQDRCVARFSLPHCRRPRLHHHPSPRHHRTNVAGYPLHVPARAVPPEEGTMGPEPSNRSIRVQQNPEYTQYTLLLGGSAEPQHIGVLRVYSVFVLHLACGMP